MYVVGSIVSSSFNVNDLGKVDEWQGCKEEVVRSSAGNVF